MFDQMEIATPSPNLQDQKAAQELFRLNSLPLIIADWITLGRSVELGPGFDDEVDDPKGPSTCLIVTLKSGAKKAAVLSAPLGVVASAYPDVVPVSTFAVAREVNEMTYDEKAIDQNFQRYRKHWNEDRCQDEYSFEDGLEIALAYAFSDIGTASLESYEPDEDYEVIPGEDLIQVSLFYQNYELGAGWGDYFLMRRPNQPDETKRFLPVRGGS